MIKYGFIVILMATFQVNANDLVRWYSSQDVTKGKVLYKENCASCHGDDAASTKDWRQKDKTGNYPPPPLNGTGHTWHHSKKLLEKTIRQGGARIGGKMPPFENKLTQEQISSVIAWFQSLWPDKIYSAWLERGGLPKSSENSKKVSKATTKPNASMTKKDPDVIFTQLNPTPVKGIFQTKFESRYVYVTEDKRYGFLGDMVDLTTGNNLTESLRQKDRLKLLEEFSLADMVIFPAKVKEKTHITVFTDTSCPFCRKLHAEIPVLLKAGVTVRYIAFPRGRERGPGYADMKSIWCAKDRTIAMDIAKGVKKGELGNGDCKAASVIDRSYVFGVKFGLKGTPAIVLSDGRIISGYRPAKNILKLINAK